MVESGGSLADKSGLAQRTTSSGRSGRSRSAGRSGRTTCCPSWAGGCRARRCCGSTAGSPSRAGGKASGATSSSDISPRSAPRTCRRSHRSPSGPSTLPARGTGPTIRTWRSPSERSRKRPHPVFRFDRRSRFASLFRVRGVRRSGGHRPPTACRDFCNRSRACSSPAPAPAPRASGPASAAPRSARRDRGDAVLELSVLPQELPVVVAHLHPGPPGDDRPAGHGGG